MPWTVSHNAAILPLRRFTPWPLDFAALVVGSMTPDLGYHINWFDLATYDHTLAGSVLAGLPVGLILFLAFYLFCKPVAYALPRPHRQVLRPLCPSFHDLWLARWPIICVSLLLGIWIHIFWDSFTHDTGWFVERIWWLRDPIVHFGSVTFPLPFVLQMASTFVGLAIILVVYFRWLNRQKRLVPNDNESDTWRYLSGVLICLLALLVAVPLAVHLSAAKQGVLYVRSIMFRTAIYAPAVAIPLGLLVACVFYLRRRPV